MRTDDIIDAGHCGRGGKLAAADQNAAGLGHRDAALARFFELLGAGLGIGVDGGVVQGRTGTARNLGGNTKAALFGLILGNALADLFGLGIKGVQVGTLGVDFGADFGGTGAQFRNGHFTGFLSHGFTLPKVSV